MYRHAFLFNSLLVCLLTAPAWGQQTVEGMKAPPSCQVQLAACKNTLKSTQRQLSRCTTNLHMCTNDLADCRTDLDACEAEPRVVLPGDGQGGTALDFGLYHGPALSYTDNGDGTFTDNNTRLMWEMKDSSDGAPNLSNPHDVDNRYNWTNEQIDGDDTDPDGTLFTNFLTMLNNPPCFAGFCDWRIPTIKELQSIVDYTKPISSDPNPATSVPGATAPAFYYSSSTVAAATFTVWAVSFGDGHVSWNYKNVPPSVSARAVRGGQG